MPEVSFREWIFDVNVDRTKEVFSTVDGGGSEDCVCEMCENYRSQKSKVFPTEVREFFETVGIDYQKECETYTTHKLDDGSINYCGWFHFAGRMLLGPNAKRKLSENSWAVDLNPIDDGFQIGFSDDRDLTFFDKNETLVQVEFQTGLPWVIDKPQPKEI